MLKTTCSSTTPASNSACARSNAASRRVSPGQGPARSAPPATASRQIARAADAVRSSPRICTVPLPLVDYHVHTARCGHAVGAMERYVEHAIESGLTEVGFSDHLFLYWLPPDRR